MRFQKLDLNLLVAMDVLLAERNVTKAAKKLNLSQSAASGMLARLREYFDDELLVYAGRNMIPTALAQSLAGPVRNLLLQIQSTVEIKPEFSPAESTRRFRVIASDYASSVAVSKLIRHISVRAPQVKIAILTPSDWSFEQLERGEIDLLLIPKQYELTTFPSELLFTDTYSCVAWTHNSSVSDTLTMEQYLSMGHVGTSFGSRGATFEDLFLQRTGQERRIEITTGHFTGVPELIVGTERIATMHTRLARKFTTYLPLRLLPLPMAMPPMEMLMQWHWVQDKDPAHVWFRTMLKDALADGHAP